MLCPSAKCNYVTGSLWECLRVVGPESQGGQIQALTRPTQRPSGAAGSAGYNCARTRRLSDNQGSIRDCRQQSLGAPQISVEQSGKNNLFGNAAGVPGYHSYYLSCMISKTYAFSLYSRLCTYVSIYTGYIWARCRRCLRGI